MANSTRKNRRELASDATREDLLAAGVDLAHQALASGEADPLRLLSPTAIAERASELSDKPVTRGMLYHLWPQEPDEPEGAGDRLDAYRVALFCRLFEEAHRPQRFTDLVTNSLSRKNVDDSRPPFADVICHIANAQFEAYKFGGAESDRYHRATFLTVIGGVLRRAGKLSDADLMKTRARRQFERLIGLYEDTFRAYDLELIPPIQIADLQQMLVSIQDGFVLDSWHFDRLDATHDLADWPQDDWKEAGERWTPFAIASYALIRAVTRKRSSAN